MEIEKRTSKHGLVPVVVTIVITAVIIGTIIAVLNGKALFNIVTLATNTRDHVLPIVAERQRTAINIERLSRFGEIILSTPDKNRRREIRFAAQILCNDAVFENDPQIKEKIKEAFEVIRTISDLRDKADKYQRIIERRLSDISKIILSLQTASEEISNENIDPVIYNIASLQIIFVDAAREGNEQLLENLKTKSENILQYLNKRIINPADNTLNSKYAQVPDVLNKGMEVFDLKQKIFQANQNASALWTNVSNILNEMADSISMNAAAIAAERFTLITERAKQTVKISLAGFAGFVLIALILILFARRYVIVPILKATQALKVVEDEHRTIKLPAIWLRELDAVCRAVERLGRVVEDVEEANRKMTDSIRYAMTIQHSLLPDPESIKLLLPDSFFIWMPRDIVSGDFIFTEISHNNLIIAVFDCTGHGVPGAFMTIIAASGLKKIVIDEKCLSPNEILKKLNLFVKTSLHQDSSHALSDDGMDAAICFIEPEQKCLTFAGARLPLYLVHNGELTIFKGDRQSIGYKRSDENFNFTYHRISLESGMCFYLATDGFVDQLGEKINQRFGKKKFGDMLKENARHDMKMQSELLIYAFENHRGSRDVLDDITVVGFRWN